MVVKKSIEPIIMEYGTGFPKLAFVACVHGNEQIGLKILEALKKEKILKGTVKLIVANPQACFKSKRFIECDLNRSFPGDRNGKQEEKIAYYLKNELKDEDAVIDFHTTFSDTPPFIIVRKKSKMVSRLANASGIGKIVNVKFKEKTSLIDNVNAGISIELGRHNLQATLNAGIKSALNILSDFGIIKRRSKKIFAKKEVFTVKDVIKAKKGFTSKNIKNFRLVKKGTKIGTRAGLEILAQEDFYPILFGEKYYKNILCWKGKK